MTILQGNEDQIVTHSHAGALACGAAAVVAVLVYLNALHNPFVYDDHHTVVDNPSIERLDNLRGIVLHDVTRPLVNLSYAIDRRVWGRAPFGYHLTNVLLHAADVMLLFVFARSLYVVSARSRTGDDAEEVRLKADTTYAQYVASGFSRTNGATLMAFTAAILFAVHPMMTEAVGYVSGRSELLCGFFFLLAMMAGLRWLRGGGLVWASVTVALWAGALASKEIGAMFPFVLACCDEFVNHPDGDQRRRRWKTVHGPLIGFAVAAGLARVAILTRLESPGRALIHWPYALVALDVIRQYAVLLVSPRGQTIFHAVTPIDGLASQAGLIVIASVAGMLWVVWSLRRMAGIVAFGVLWFVLLLVPGAALTTLNVGEPMAEHRVYLASCGVFLAAGDGIGRLRAWSIQTGAAARGLVPGVLSLVVVALGAQTLARNAVWRAPSVLWRESVDLAPTHYRPRVLLGEALQDEGKRDEAMNEYKIAIQLRPKDPTAYVKLAAVLVTIGRTTEARQLYTRALELDPHEEVARRALRFLDRVERPHGNDGARR
jgi:tetratricopeptide (TPR) repeat protein